MKAVLVALLAGMIGCTAVHPIWAAGTVTYREKVLWSFGSGTDGRNPYANLIDVNGILYGTTAEGGGAPCGGSGCGTVFSLDPSTGAEKVLYSFCRKQNCADGANPAAALIDMNGLLYSTTVAGGKGYTACGSTYGCGTVFALDPSSANEKVLYSFCTYPICADGTSPVAGLVGFKGTLYGTTQWGGTDCWPSGCGTVFSLDPEKRAEKVLHSFGNYALPYAGLIAVKGILYGTTVGDGRSGCTYFSTYCGTAFSVDPSTGSETVTYSFCSQEHCTDGADPTASLIAVRGELYGTTFVGGGTGCGGYGCGTVFSLDPGTGAETVLYSFAGGVDGESPVASLIHVKGVLYGTTYYGGGTGCGGYGCGTVFSLDPGTGAQTVLYSFCGQTNCTDGANPYASLVAVNGDLYGTTQSGGADGYGTVFVLKKKH